MLECKIPPSYNKTKCMVMNLGLDYEKIDAYPNDCMLFKNDHMDDEFCHTCGVNDHMDDEFCHTCGALRYAKYLEVDSELDPSKKQHRVSSKTLRHIPLTPKL